MSAQGSQRGRPTAEGRRCESCRAPLATDNTAWLCGRCLREQKDQLRTPPVLKDEFFDTDDFKAAFKNHHIGKVVKAYRNHPQHLRLFGKALNQEVVGRWLGLNQAQVSRLENGPPEENIKTLRHYAEVLHLPRHLLWFYFPGETRSSLVVAQVEDPQALAASVARDSLDFLQWAEDDRVAPSVLEHVNYELRRIAVDYVAKPLTPLLNDLVSVRDMTFGLLRERPHPNQARELFFVAGTVCVLLAHASQNLGNPAAAMTQARTAWACAEQADNDDLRAWVRGTQALIAEWSDRYEQAVTFARQGQKYAVSVDSHVRLAAIEARTLARMGNTAEAAQAVERARQARTRPASTDALADFGGILTFPEVKQLYYAGSTLALASKYADAEQAALDAIRMYETGPLNLRSYGDEALARVDVAVARVARDDLDGAKEVLAPVLALPQGQRIRQIVAGLDRVRRHLADARFAGSSVGHEISEEISGFAGHNGSDHP